MKCIAIIGAAGYVGLELVRQLSGTDYKVYAVARENGQFLLRDSGHELVAPANLGSVGTVDVVVNLAYPASGLPYHYPLKNQEILAQVKSLMGPDSRLIHVSTQAVFGFGLDRPIVVGPVTMVRDYAYIEAKIELENLFLREFGNQGVQIVRLGNVWGPGSGAWTVPLVHKILFGESVGVSGVDGYCNVTDVANTASYLVHLIGRDDLRRVDFFHLAELSGYRWSDWIGCIEAALGEKALYEAVSPPYPVRVKEDVWKAIAPMMPGPLYKKLIWGRFSGSWLRSLVRVIGDKQFMKLKNSSVNVLPVGHTLAASDEMFLGILGAQKKFETAVLADWVPPVDFSQSWAHVEKWMATAGYSVTRVRQC